MVLLNLSRGKATAFRLGMLALVVWSVLGSSPAPATSGRGLVVLVLLVAAVAAFVYWTIRPLPNGGVTLDLYAMAIAGGLLVAAAPRSAAAAFVFVAVVAAGVRVNVARALPLLGLGTLALGVSVVVYDARALSFLAYSLGFAAALLAASNARQSVVRADQAELLLAQAQRSKEEALRATRLEESTRLAREMHDVLAHSLAGLSIQLEATEALIERGEAQGVVLERLRRARALVGDGMQEIRDSIGALRGEAVAVPDAIRSIVDSYDGPAELDLHDEGRLTGAPGLAVLRAVQESITNVQKHAPGASVSVVVEGGDEELVAIVCDRAGGSSSKPLADSGGGYGLRGMRERAQRLGGTMSAGATADGWRVELRVPVAAGAA